MIGCIYGLLETIYYYPDGDGGGMYVHAVSHTRGYYVSRNDDWVLSLVS